MKTPHTIIIGAGIGGLTAGALLLKAGHQVTVLEAHVYPGGSAGTFYHKKYRFDAGATLAGGFSEGGPHARVAQMLGLEWPVRPVDPAWVVHLPNGRSVTQWTDPDRWRTERQSAFPQAEPFWRKQELLADISWDISARPFPWPPESVRDWITLAKALRPKTLLSLPYLFRTIGDVAPTDDPMFKTFLDAQLLIAAQTTSDHTNALYGSAALDLPRRGVNHVEGGIGALAKTLADWIRSHGGDVHYRQQVTAIEVQDGRATAVTTNKGLHLNGDNVLTNLTPWALTDLLGEDAPPKLRNTLQKAEPTWGAFTLYLGVAESKLPPDLVGHHQVIVDHTQPPGEGNTVFISFSDAEDDSRAPAGKRAVTMSTHTEIATWWQLRQSDDESAYLTRRQRYVQKMLDAAETAVPGLRHAIELCLPGTPVTFEFYTRRPGGMVGGFPQKSIFKALGPGTGLENVWLVGDSIFPGQSTAGVTLGGIRVATAVLQAGNAAQSLFRPIRFDQPLSHTQ